MHNENRSVITAVQELQEQFRGRLIRIATQKMRFPDGGTKTFEFAERAPGVRVLVTDGSSILLSREWRTESQRWDYRLPGGKVFDSLSEYLLAVDENPDCLEAAAQAAAQKELEEETLLKLPRESFNLHHRSVCGATIVWDLFYYVVEIAARENLAANVLTHEGEQTRPEWHEYADVLELGLNGQIGEDRTLGFLFRYLLNKQKAG